MDRNWMEELFVSMKRILVAVEVGEVEEAAEEVAAGATATAELLDGRITCSENDVLAWL